MVKTKAKAPTPISSGYVPQDRTRTIEFVEKGVDLPEGAEHFRITTRGHVTVAEFEQLVWGPKTPTRDMFEKLAPYVVGWNLKARDDNGDLYEVPPPAVAGPQVFEHIPDTLVYQILVSVKMRSVSPVDPKPWTPFASTPEQSSDSEPASE